MLSAVLFSAALVAFAPPTTTVSRAVVVSPAADVVMMAARPSKKKSAPRSVEPAKFSNKGVTGFGTRITGKEKPLSAGSNYPTTKNIQIQSTGFGTFVQSFQKRDGKSKYGMPIFLPNGNINPAYLAAERKAMASQSKRNVGALGGKTKKMKAARTFKLGDWISKEVGPATNR